MFTSTKVGLHIDIRYRPGNHKRLYYIYLQVHVTKLILGATHTGDLPHRIDKI